MRIVARLARRIVSRSSIPLLAGLLACACSTAALAQSKPTQHSAIAETYAASITEASRRFTIPAAWIKAVMRTESAGDPNAISSAGAMGLMQIMPDTWADLRVQHQLGRNPYNPHDNIIAGAAYIRELLDRYGSPGWVAAYNAGPGRYEASLAGRPLPSETRAYVATVAPIIGAAAAANPIMIAAADPFAWTRAPLFVMQPNRISAADTVQSGRATDGGSAVIQARDVTAMVPQSDGLFVTRIGWGSRP